MEGPRVQYVFVPIIFVVAGGLLWTWWSSRADRDPVHSVGQFNRALGAMRPGDRAAQAEDAHADGEG